MSWSSSRRRSRRGGLRRLLRLGWELSWKGALTLLIPITLLIAWYSWKASQFDLSEVAKMPARTVLLDRHGVEYGSIHGQNRRLVEPEDIPHFLKRSLFVREDSRFMEHEGVDFLGLVRATIRNLRDGDFTQGASTISMQLARNTYDLREKKSLNRKFLELALTYRVESRYSKDEILTHYLNRIYFGSGCNGIEEAALTYFGRPTSDLTIGQMALLVGIIRAPHTFSPWRNLDGALAQRDEVLNRLVTENELGAEEAEKIKKLPLKLREPYSSMAETSHGTRAMRRPLEVVLSAQAITTGGLKVHTSLDFPLQQKLEKLLILADLPENLQAAALALDPRTGDVLAIIGCRESHPTGFNRALKSYRDLGPQMMEPLIDTIAQERGHLPVTGRPVVTGRQVGHRETIQLLKNFGFSRIQDRGDDLYRGALSASVVELAVAYSAITQSGIRPTPLFIRSITDHDQKLFQRSPNLTKVFRTHAFSRSHPSSLSGYSLPKTDFWATQLSPKCVIVLWLGHDRPKRFQLAPEVRKTIKKELQELTASPAK